jgi:predicted small secreted protein
MIKRSIGILILVLVFSTVFSGTFADTTTVQKQVNQYGATNGNLVNGGLFAKQGDWIYFRNKYENFSLYKMKLDGSNITKVSNIDCHAINIIGEWIYFSNGSDEHRIYKMKTDGTQVVKINNDKYVGRMLVVGNWIYYSDDSSAGRLRKIKLDGTGKTYISTKDAHDFNIIGETVYYREVSSIYKSGTDGTKKVKLVDNVFNGVFQVEGDWVYYRNTSDNFKLYKVKTDGSKKTKVGDVRTDCFNISDGWIYYDNFEGGFYKIKTDGKENTKLNASGSIEDICIIDDWLFFSEESLPYRMKKDNTSKLRVDGLIVQNPEDNSKEILQGDINKLGNTNANINNNVKVAKQGDWIFYFVNRWNTILCREKTDGTNKAYMKNVVGENLNVIGDSIYFTSGNYIYKHLINGGNETKFDIGFVGNVYVAGEWIYYSSYSDDKIYTIKTDGTGKRILINCRAKSFNIVDDKIYYINSDDTYYSLYMMNLDGSNNTKVRSYYYQDMVIYNNNIYYKYPYKGNEGKLYSGAVGGKSEKKLCDDIVGKINVYNDVIYYINESDKNNIYRINIDGTGRKKLLDVNTWGISIIDEWIYYNKFDDGNLYKVKIDGTQNQVIK